MNPKNLKESFPQNLLIVDDPIIKFFSKSLKSNLSEHLTALILFGSRARGEAREHSDYDFLIIVDKKDRDIKSKIVDVEVETLDRFEKLTSSLVWEEKDWELKKRFPIGLNILKEGILL
ncbi:MAG: nucleotidyltransferase domain-containing protein [Leptospiraceae bacterium]|nr:nucleotidyltransferase domain-containing protein [Leptospiraceae bacterium]